MNTGVGAGGGRWSEVTILDPEMVWPERGPSSGNYPNQYVAFTMNMF